MRLGTGSDPGAEEGWRGIGRGSSNKLVGRLTEGSIRTKSDRPEPDVEPLVLDDPCGPAVLRRGIRVGGNTT